MSLRRRKDLQTGEVLAPCGRGFKERDASRTHAAGEVRVRDERATSRPPDLRRALEQISSPPRGAASDVEQGAEKMSYETCSDRARVRASRARACKPGVNGR